MSSGPGDEPVVERILDVAVYGPVGLALSVVEAVPRLVRKGRDRLAPQVGVARTVGEFTVRQGYRQFVGFATGRGASPFKTSEAGKTYTAYTAKREGPDRAGGHDGRTEMSGAAQTSTGQTSTGQTSGRQTSTAPTSIAAAPDDQALPVQAPEPREELLQPPRAGDLAIPSYDSLSASQVVQRLAGLSREEVAAVAAYEAAIRGRKTVLARADQLLKPSR